MWREFSFCARQCCGLPSKTTGGSSGSRMMLLLVIFVCCVPTHSFEIDDGCVVRDGLSHNMKGDVLNLKVLEPLQPDMTVQFDNVKHTPATTGPSDHYLKLPPKDFQLRANPPQLRVGDTTIALKPQNVSSPVNITLNNVKLMMNCPTGDPVWCLNSGTTENVSIALANVGKAELTLRLILRGGWAAVRLKVDGTTFVVCCACNGEGINATNKCDVTVTNSCSSKSFILALNHTGDQYELSWDGKVLTTINRPAGQPPHYLQFGLEEESPSVAIAISLGPSPPSVPAPGRDLVMLGLTAACLGLLVVGAVILLSRCTSNSCTKSSWQSMREKCTTIGGLCQTVEQPGKSCNPNEDRPPAPIPRPRAPDPALPPTTPPVPRHKKKPLTQKCSHNDDDHDDDYDDDYVTPVDICPVRPVEVAYLRETGEIQHQVHCMEARPHTSASRQQSNQTNISNISAGSYQRNNLSSKDFMEQDNTVPHREYDARYQQVYYYGHEDPQEYPY